MKVDNNGLNRINRPEMEGTRPLDKSLRTNETPADIAGLTGKDTATVSDQARLLAKARTTLEETPDVRTDRVNDLRNQIQTGNYQVPHEEIVKRLLTQFRSAQNPLEG